tara:strand:+ start:2151 stop:2564 length:414 start_codon:yes stop_codon:yes gene_type:complete
MDTFFLFFYQNIIAFTLLILCLIALIIYEGKKGGTKVDPVEATRLINREGAVVVDLRASEEFSTGHITGSINISAEKLEQQLNSIKHSKEAPLILVCKTGNNSKTVGGSLLRAGYSNVNLISGGMTTWQGSGLPLSK